MSQAIAIMDRECVQQEWLCRDGEQAVLLLQQGSPAHQMWLDEPRKVGVAVITVSALYPHPLPGTLDRPQPYISVRGYWDDQLIIHEAAYGRFTVDRIIESVRRELVRPRGKRAASKPKKGLLCPTSR